MCGFQIYGSSFEKARSMVGGLGTRRGGKTLQRHVMFTVLFMILAAMFIKTHVYELLQRGRPLRMFCNVRFCMFLFCGVFVCVCVCKEGV